jgi:hypothetical protein
MWVHRQPQYNKFALAEADTPSLPNCRIEQSLLSVCTVNDAGAPTVVLFGDSHAEHWAPPLEQLALQNGWKLVIVAKPTCAAPDEQSQLPDQGRHEANRVCIEWRRTAIQKIRELRPSAVVVASYSKGYVEPVGKLSVSAWEAITRATLIQLSGVASHVFLIEDPPSPTVDIPDCLSRADWTHKPEDICEFRRHDEIGDSISASESSATAGLANVTALDLSPYICGPAICSPTESGTIKYSDAHHLTETFTRSLAPALGRLLSSNGLQLRAPLASPSLAPGASDP